MMNCELRLDINCVVEWNIKMWCLLHNSNCALRSLKQSCTHSPSITFSIASNMDSQWLNIQSQISSHLKWGVLMYDLFEFKCQFPNPNAEAPCLNAWKSNVMRLIGPKHHTGSLSIDHFLPTSSQFKMTCDTTTHKWYPYLLCNW